MFRNYNSALTITDNPCYADAGFTYTLGSGGSVQFSKNLPLNNTVAYWKFGDGYTSTLSNPSHTYTSGGIFNVSLGSYHPSIPAYNFNCRATNSVNLNITGIPCVANANFTIQPTGQLHTYWIIPANPYNVSAVLWSWGDGNTTNSSNIYANHTYSAAGTYDVCLTVTTTCGTSSNSATYCSTQYLPKGSAGDMVYISVIEPVLISGVEELKTEDIDMELYPNPTDGIINIKLKDETNSFEIEIYDLLGKKVYYQSFKEMDSSRKIDLSHLNNGIYFLNLKIQQKGFSSKFILSR